VTGRRRERPYLFQTHPSRFALTPCWSQFGENLLLRCHVAIRYGVLEATSIHFEVPGPVRLEPGQLAIVHSAASAAGFIDTLPILLGTGVGGVVELGHLLMMDVVRNVCDRIIILNWGKELADGRSPMGFLTSLFGSKRSSRKTTSEDPLRLQHPTIGFLNLMEESG